MASWRDGAEYAPTERPDGFAAPKVGDLPVATPHHVGTPGAVAPPAQWCPPPTGVALDTLVPTSVAPRDPASPFDIASTPMAGESAWGGAHRVGSPAFVAEFDPYQPMGSFVDQFPPPVASRTPVPAPWPQPGPPGAGSAWGPPVPAPATPETPARSKTAAQILWVGVGLLTIAVLIPPAATLLLFVVAGLLYRIERRFSIVVGISATVPLLLLFTDQPSAPSIASFLGFCWLVGCTGLALRSLNRDR